MRIRLASPGALAAALVLLLAGAQAAAAQPVARLESGQSAFWAGAFVSDSRVDDPSLCGIEGECFNYGIHVTAPHAKVLRAAIASFDDSNGWDVRLLDPSGHEAASGSTYTLGGIAENYDAELFLHNPRAGMVTVQVHASSSHPGA